VDFVLGFTHDNIIIGKSLAKNEGQGDNKKTLVVKERALTAAEFHRLAEVPPAIEWVWEYPQ
jgi:hypothetical protein